MTTTATAITREHFQRPEVKGIIGKYAMPGDGAWRALNGDFHHWYGYLEDGRARLLHQGDYDSIIEQHRTLYQTLNVFEPALLEVARPREKITSDNPLGTPADTVAYTPSVDIDKGEGCNINDPEVRHAVEAAAQFLVNYLKENGIHESVWVLFSGAGIYVVIHHEICKPKSTSPEDRAEFFELVTDRYNRLITRVSEEFFKAHPEHIGKVKYDALNNSKRIFKCILSIHKKKPYAVTPLNRDAIKINLKRAKVPLKDDMIAEARTWYSTYGPAEREPFLMLLDDLQETEEEAKRSKRRFEEIYRSPVKIEAGYFPPCIKHILDVANLGEGKTRFSAVLSTFLYQMGWDEEEAWNLVKGVSDCNGLGNAGHIFDSCFGRISCPSCSTIQNDAAGYPHLGLKGFGACESDEKCNKWPGGYGKDKGNGTEITEEELAAYSMPEGPKFECRLPNNHFLQRHMAYGSEISDAYPDYWLASGLFSLAVVADKKLKIILKQGTIYPNLYISINGKSSLSRKSTVVNKTEEMLCQVLWQLLSALVPTEFSPEAFTEHLSDHNHAPWIRDEAAGVLSLMKRDYMRGFKDSLMQLFDCKPFYRKLRTSQRKNVKTEFRVDDPYLNVLFATTEASLAANTDQNDTLSGFLARFLFFFPQGQKPKWLPLEEGTAQNSIFEGVIRDQLGGIAQKMDALKESTAMHFSSEAASYFTEWQRIREDEWTASNDGFCMQIYSRLAPTVAKLGMLFELGSPDFEVSKPIRLEFIQEACRLVDSYFMPTARAVYDLVGSNAEKNVIDRITAYLKNHGGKATKKEILRDVKIKSVDFKEYFATMLESGMVETKIVKRGGKGRDSLWVVLLDQGKVGNVTNVANVAKVAKAERDYSIERKDSTLATLATTDILPSVAPKGKESHGIGPHPRQGMPTPGQDEELRALLRFRTDYKTEWPRGGGRYESITYQAGDECVAPLKRAVKWQARGVAQILDIDYLLGEAPA